MKDPLHSTAATTDVKRILQIEGGCTLVDAIHDGALEVPVVGRVSMPPAVLIRPDGHVAWTGSITDPGLADAVAAWFGARID